MEFKEIQTSSDERMYKFTLTPIHVAYANTLRRIIMTGVETVAFRADMTSSGTTTDVLVKKNDTPMTNEMLADRIGLLPIHIKDPITWKNDDYQFILDVSGDKENVRYVKASDFKVKKLGVKPPANLSYDEKENSDSISSIRSISNQNESNQNESKQNESNQNESNQNESNQNNSIQGGTRDVLNESQEGVFVSTESFFPPHPITNDTCLIASLQPGSGASQQSIHIIAKATKGTGREHARFCPTSQCSYMYTPDKNPDRIRERFEHWLQVTKKVGSIDESSDRFKTLQREFNTMEVNRCYLMNEKNEPYSFDFTIESAGVLPVPYIIERACEVGENMCSRYTQFDAKDLPSEITIRTSEARITGFDILFRKQDHTLGNLLQTWIEQNLIDRPDSKVTYIGYSIPHPLRDEMLLRIGVSDGEEKTARAAIALAAKGCAELFHQLRNAWRKTIGQKEIVPASTRKVVRRATPSAKMASAEEIPLKVNVTKSD